MGWVAGPQTWTLGGEAPSSAGGDIHAAHDHAAMMQAMPTPAQSASSVGLHDIVAKAMPEKLAFPVIVTPPGAPGRSEEHTSELLSLMRISYAVFCLKKK